MDTEVGRNHLIERGLVPEMSERAAHNLSAAARRGDLAAVEAYVAIGFSPDCTGGLHESTPLVVAAASANQAELIRLLGKLGADLDAFDLSQTALHKAVAAGHLDSVRALLECGARTDLSCKNDWTPLSRAIKEQRRELVELLLDHQAWTGGRPNAMVFALGGQDDWFVERLLRVPGQAEAIVDEASGKTPLMAAALEDNASRIDAILATGARVDQVNSFGWTARMMAEFNGKEAASRALQRAGAAPSEPHLFGAVRAASAGDVTALKEALDAGASPDARNRLGISLVTSAAGAGHDAVIELLVERGAELDVPEESGKVNALAFSLMRGQLGTAELLLKLGADATACSAAALNACVKAQRREWLERLLDLGAQVNDADSLGQSPLFWASNKGFGDLARLLIDRGAEVNQATNTGATPLHTAILNAHEPLVEVLLGAGANPDCLDDSTMTPLRLAVQKAHSTGKEVFERIARRLVLAGADPDATVFGLAPLHDDFALRSEVEAYQTKGKMRRIAAQLGILESPTCLDPEAVAHSGKMPDEFYRALVDDQSADTLAKLMGSGRTELKQALLRVGVDWGARELAGLSPLALAAGNYDGEMVKALLEAGCDPNQTDRDGETPLIVAARTAQLELVRSLLDAGADPNLRSRTVWDGVHEHGAVRNNNPHAPDWRADLESRARRRVKHDSPGQAACQNRGMQSPVQAAAARGQIEVLEELKRRGARLDVLDAGQDVLSDAIRNDRERAAIWLLEHGADPNRHVRGHSVLLEAVERDLVRVVEALLEHGADPNVAVEGTGQTPLLLACSRGRTDVLDKLLEAGADANHADEEGKNAFDWASSRGIRDHLLSSPLAKLTDKLKNWAQNLGVARPAALSPVPLPGIMGRLGRRELGFGPGSAPPSAEELELARTEADERGDTPLMAAVLLDDEELVKALLESGSDPNRTNKHGDSAWVYATTGCSKAVQQLINAQCKANPLQQIMLYDRIEKLEYALKQGDLQAVRARLTEQTNSLHLLRAAHSPLRFAIRRRDERMVRLLLDLGVDPEAEISRARVPLIEAAQEGSDDAAVMQHLLEAGADPWAKDHDHLALHFAVSAGNVPEARLLLGRMGELDWRREELRNVLVAARSGGRVEALELLRAAGASTG